MKYPLLSPVGVTQSTFLGQCELHNRGLIFFLKRLSTSLIGCSLSHPWLPPLWLKRGDIEARPVSKNHLIAGHTFYHFPLLDTYRCLRSALLNSPSLSDVSSTIIVLFPSSNALSTSILIVCFTGCSINPISVEKKLSSLLAVRPQFRVTRTI